MEMMMQQWIVPIIFFCIGLIVGFCANILLNRWINIDRKLFDNGAQSKENIKNAIVIILLLVWVFATFVSIIFKTPIDPSIHLIVGGVLGTYFGSNIFDKNAKKE